MKDTINDLELALFLTDMWVMLPDHEEENFLASLKKIGLNSLIKSFIDLSYAKNERVRNHYTQMFLQP